MTTNAQPSRLREFALQTLSSTIATLLAGGIIVLGGRAVGFFSQISGRTVATVAALVLIGFALIGLAVEFLPGRHQDAWMENYLADDNNALALLRRVHEDQIPIVMEYLPPERRAALMKRLLDEDT